jgi:hypothetical protein
MVSLSGPGRVTAAPGLGVPAARTLRAQLESGSPATTYRLPLTVSGETGAERGLPVRRPGTVSRQTGPIVSPIRDMASAARLVARSQRGGGLTSGMADQASTVSGSPGLMTLTGTSGARRLAASTKRPGSLSLLVKSMSPMVPPVKA